jgi:methyltransferase-like protein
MNFNATSVVKFVASGIVGMGTGKIVSAVIDKVSIVAASFVISGIATKATKKYTDETIDETIENVTKAIVKFKTDGKLAKINRGESTIEDEGLDEDKFEWTSEGKLVPKKDDEPKPVVVPDAV